MSERSVCGVEWSVGDDDTSSLEGIYDNIVHAKKSVYDDGTRGITMDECKDCVCEEDMESSESDCEEEGY